MDSLVSYKNEINDLKIEFDVIPLVDINNLNDKQIQIYNDINLIDEKIALNQKELDILNSEIDTLTNHADGIDYMVAVGSGILTGILDSIFVGEYNPNIGNEKVNDFVINSSKNKKMNKKINQEIIRNENRGSILSEENKEKIRQSVGQEFDLNENEYKTVLERSIRFLEDNYKLPGDNKFNIRGSLMNSKTHHLDDLAHHPSIFGLLYSIIRQFIGKGFYQNSEGNYFTYELEEELIGNNFGEKIMFGTINWFWHLISDIAGSRKSAGEGMGIPGPILSLAKEISMIPGINKTPLPKIINDIYIKGFDFRDELNVTLELGRQSIPVILNEVLVRCFYFVRRLSIEIKEKQSISDVDWEKIKPYKNRTIIRMLTISTGTFMAVDLADAAIHASIKSGGNPALMLGNMALRVNFVGVGRFAVALSTDIKMEMKKYKKTNERMKIFSQQLYLYNAKIYYKRADAWITAENTGNAILELYDEMENSILVFNQSWDEIRENTKDIGKSVKKIQEKNSMLIDEMMDILEFY